MGADMSGTTLMRDAIMNGVPTGMAAKHPIEVARAIERALWANPLDTVYQYLLLHRNGGHYLMRHGVIESPVRVEFYAEGMVTEVTELNPLPVMDTTEQLHLTDNCWTGVIYL